MPRSHRLGDLQLVIMRVLWDRGEATVAQVHEALRGDRELAPTTVATMLSKMEKKGVVAHRTEQRKFVYRAVVGERDVHRSMVRQLVDQLFGGDSTALVHHLVSEGEIEPGELDELRDAVERKGGRRGR